jgi:hypothetical protein
MSSFPGVNASMYWFMAIVENIYDPDMAGKIKIRVIGKDTSDTMATPSESLPWAPCLLPANFSRKTIDVEPGDWVVGFYVDGPTARQPMILGVIPGITTSTG